jgi:type II secretory pathway component PulF
VAGVGAALPDPAELFRRMQAEEEAQELPVPNELFRRLRGVESEQPQAEISDGLPALPDLDAFRAELEAEERARLDADLLGDLSGPERFADTVSDLEFKTGSFFQEPPPAVHKPTLQRQEKILPPPPPAPSAPAEPLPAMLQKPPSTPKPQPLPSPAKIAYQPAPKPVRKKSASTAIMPAEGTPAATRARVQLADRLARYKARRKSLSLHTLSVFTRQMAAMLKAGIPLHQSISFCAEADPVAAPVLEDICHKVESGYSMSGALKDYPESFNAVYVGLVHAGELSGRLNEMLAKLADILERELDLRKRMISVITYPAMLMSVSILGTLGFIFFVLPQLEPMFLDLKVDLPWPTKVLLSLRTILVPLVAVLALAAAILAVMKSRIVAYVRARPSLERRLAHIPLTVPILGKVYERMITARVLYSLATMLEVGVTMGQALARAEGATGNAYVGYRLTQARQDLSDGSSVTECFAAHRVFPETALQLIAAGEESARVVDMFNYIAKHFDEEVEQAMTAAAGLLEPLIMVGMGLIVGFITIAAALPTIKLLQGF